jgi:hypothetical protein
MKGVRGMFIIKSTFHGSEMPDAYLAEPEPGLDSLGYFWSPNATNAKTFPTYYAADKVVKEIDESRSQRAAIGKQAGGSLEIINLGTT